MSEYLSKITACLAQIEREEGERLNAVSRLVADTTGAGDTFNGVLAAGIADKQDIERACQTANTAAAIKVTRKYILDSIPTRDEIESYEKE